MEDVRCDVLVVARQQASGALVEHDEARGVRGADHLVRVVHAGAGVHVQMVAVDEHRSVRAVVRPDADLLRHVEEPDDVAVQRPGRDGLRRRVGAAGHHVPAFVEVRAGVAVGHAARVEAHHLTAVAHGVHAVAFDRDRRRPTGLGPVEVRVLLALGHEQLPEQMAVLLVEAEQDAGITGALRVARLLVVRAVIHAAAGDDGRGVGMGADLGGPAHVLARLRVEGTRQAALRGHEVAGPRLSPLRLVAGEQRQGGGKAGTGGHHGTGQAGKSHGEG